jgi:hypothetical protein
VLQVASYRPWFDKNMNIPGNRTNAARAGSRWLTRNQQEEETRVSEIMRVVDVQSSEQAVAATLPLLLLL